MEPAVCVLFNVYGNDARSELNSSRRVAESAEGYAYDMIVNRTFVYDNYLQAVCFHQMRMTVGKKMKQDSNGLLITTCESIIKEMDETYGVKQADKHGECPKCTYKVYLVLRLFGFNIKTGQK